MILREKNSLFFGMYYFLIVRNRRQANFGLVCRRYYYYIMNFRFTLYFSRWGHSRNPTVGHLSTAFDKRKATSPGGDSKISSLTFAFGVVDISHRASGLAFLPRDRKGASSNERPRLDIHFICANVCRYLISNAYRNILRVLRYTYWNKTDDALRDALIFNFFSQNWI